MRLCGNALTQLVIPAALEDEMSTCAMLQPGGRLYEQRKAVLDERLRILREHIAAKPQVDTTFFKPDLYKYGGEYINRSGQLFRIDAISGTLRFSDGFTVAIEDIYEIESEIFGSYY